MPPYGDQLTGDEQPGAAIELQNRPRAGCQVWPALRTGTDAREQRHIAFRYRMCVWPVHRPPRVG